MATRQMWSIEVKHPGLNKYRRITGSNRYVVEQKAHAQRATWDDMWRRHQEAESKRATRDAAARDKDSNKKMAADKTEAAEQEIDNLRNTLHHTLSIDDTIDWEYLLDRSAFAEPEPFDTHQTTRKYTIFFGCGSCGGVLPEFRPVGD
jgi:restriction system protein